MKKTLLTLALLLMGIGAYAADVLYTVTFGETDKQETCNQYTETWVYTLNESCKWSLTAFSNNNNQWANVRCGRKANSSVASITTSFAMPEEITSVDVTFDAFKNADKVKSVKLEASAAADFATVATTVDLPAADFTAGTKTFTIVTPAKKLYYRLVLDMDVTGANGCIQISKIVYNGNSNIDPGKQMAELSFGDNTDFSVILGKPFTAPTLTKATTADAVYSSSNPEVATVDAASGAVTIVAAGTTTITASCAANETFNEGTASYSLTVIEEVADIAAFIEKKDTKNIVRIAGNVTVLYQNGLNLLVMDGSARMTIYGTVGQTYNTGDVIPGGFQGIYGEYGQNPQLNSPSGFEAATGKETIKPVELTSAEEFNNEPYLSYVSIKGLSISEINKKNISFMLGETAIAGYNQFSITLPTETADKKFDVIGFKGAYNGNVQLQPIEITEATSSAIDEIGVDAAEAPVEYFNLQGQRVNNPENGLFIRRQGDKVTKVIIR